MARPTKQGIDYFPLDTQFDDKIELFIIENGTTGLGILITIWQLIYQNNGYYIDNTIDLPLLIKKRIMESVEQINKIISGTLSRNIFCPEMEKEHKILTSKAIQKRYFIAANRKKIVNVYKNYLLIDVNEYKNVVYVRENATNVNVDVKGKEEEEERWILPSFINKKSWEEFEAHRKEIKKPLTDLARIKNAEVLKNCSHDEQKQIIDKTIANRWTGLFSLEKGKQSQRKQEELNTLKNWVNTED